MLAKSRMNESIPTAKTYLWFALKWILIGVVVFWSCFVLFKSDHQAAGGLTILLAVFFCARDARRIGVRAKRGVRRGYVPRNDSQ